MFNKKLSDDITLPHLDRMLATDQQWEIYTRFVGHMRHVPVSRMEIKILSAIQFTADILDSSDAHIAKELVEMGLRAPRIAFPVEFLDYVDNALLRCGWDIGAPSEEMIELRDQWFAPKEQLSLAPFRHVHTIVKEEVLATT